MGRIRHRTATAAVITTTLLVAATWAATLPGTDAIAQDREAASRSPWGDGEAAAEDHVEREQTNPTVAWILIVLALVGAAAVYVSARYRGA